MYKIFTLIKITTIIEKLVAELLEIARQNRLDLLGNIDEKHLWWDNQEVMQILKISDRTLRRRRLEGIIPFIRMGGKFLYRKSDIQRMLSK